MKKHFLLAIAALALTFACKAQQNKIIILTNTNSSVKEQLAAKELRRYMYLRSGNMAEILDRGAMPFDSGAHIIVCTKKSPFLYLSGNANLISEAPQLDSEQYIIKTLGSACFIVGGSDIGALYGAYRFLEYNGIRFYLHGDVIPDGKADIIFPKEQITGKPLFALRGIQPFHDFPQGPDWWNTDDYLAYIAQLPKMGLNFIGFHTYPSKPFTGYSKPEPVVWIGTDDQYNADGTVKTSYPAMHATTADWTWGHDRMKTSDFHFGGDQLFETDYYGPDYMLNVSEWPHTDAENINIFNSVGKLLNSSFTLAHQLGVKTCLGTETPLTIPQPLINKLKAEGKDTASDEVKRAIYEGMFNRISKTYPLDYYWLWTYEDWTWDGEKPGEVEAVERDIQNAIKAKENVKAPFTLATCGWVLGPSRDRTEFDKLFPKEMPFSCINREVGFTPIDKGFDALKNRPKWAIPWMEDDPALVCPQLWVGRTRRDAYDALRYGCTGFFGIHWRTEPLGPVISALAKATWDQSAWNKPSDTTRRDMQTDDFYEDWARAQFGKELAIGMAAIFINIDGGPLYIRTPGVERKANVFRAADWMNTGPGGIKPNRTSWSEVQKNFAYLDMLKALEGKVQGEGNKERFHFWLYTLTCNYKMAETGCLLGQIDTLVNILKAEKDVAIKKKIAEEKIIPLKREAEKKWGDVVTLLLQTVGTPGELGTIANLEQHNLTNLQALSKYDSLLTAITGKSITTELPKAYQGRSRLIVPTKRTLLGKNEDLNLKAIILSRQTSTSVVIYWRKLGDKEYNKISMNHIARGVYKGAIDKTKIAGNEIEYYIEADMGTEKLHFPATATEQNQTVVVF